MDDPPPSADAPEDQISPAAPAVVAVVVAHDPGPWFEECLASLAGQDYPNLSVLVVDAASTEDLKGRVGAAAPEAFVRRVADSAGFGAAANEVLEVVEGAAFYLVCHDDVALAPDAVRILVEEAFRSNAGLVGPKLVRWEDPRRLLQIGATIDRAGYQAPLVDRDELDQEQHDSVRDVFTVPGACTLVRADLFAAIGGFDEGIDFLYDDVSLCWRAHLSGARVVVAPLALVRHVEALDQRGLAEDRRQLEARHRLRVVLSSYSALSLLIAIPKLVVLHVGEMIYSLIVGRTANARRIASAWMWNLRRIDELRAARQQVAGLRRVGDANVRDLMMRGSARLSQFARGQVGRGENRLTGIARGGRDAAAAMRSGSFRFSAAVWAGVLLVLLAGSRHLVTRGIPAVGELVPFASSPFDLLRAWASGWRTAGLGSHSPAPTAYGLLGGLGVVSVGAMGLLRTLLTLGLIPLGGLLAYRLAGPVGSRYARVVALLVYLSIPLPYNALATGRWGALALYGAAPLVVALLARMSGQAPFGPRGGDASTTIRPSSLRHLVLSLGLVTALLAALVPVAVAVVVGMAVALALGSVLTYRTAGSGRMILGAVAAAGVAVVMHVPWSLDFLVPGTPLSAFTGAEARAPRSELTALMRFEVGPLGSGPLGWACLVAAVLPLLIGRGERLAWAVRGWAMAVVFWGIAWLAQRGDLPIAMPPVDVLLAPAAVGLALAAAMGVAAFQTDLPGYRFGWRQVASGMAATAVALATIPVIGAAFDGRWSLPGGDHARALAFIDAENDEVPFRVLWMGDPSALPLGSWELTEGVGYATTDGGNPVERDLWAGSDDGHTRLLADAVDLARTQQTARLGRLLAPMGVRYVVVPERLAPAPFSDESLPIPAGLSAVLDAQLDLEPLDVPAGLRVYRNQAFASPRAAIPSSTELPTEGGPAATVGLDLTSAVPVLPDEDGYLRWRGPVEGGTTVLLSAAHSDSWQLSVEGSTADHTKAFGWGNGFRVESDGEATLRFRTPFLRYLILLLQVVGWLWVARTVLRGRMDRSEGAST